MENTKTKKLYILAAFLLANFANLANSAFSFCNIQTNAQNRAEQFLQKTHTQVGQNNSAILDHIGDFTLANHQSRSDTPLTPNTGTLFNKRFSHLKGAEAKEAYKQYRKTHDTNAELVIGRLEDTAAGGQLGMTRLNTNSWTPNVNDAFIQGGIDAKKTFYLGSSPNITNYRSAGVFNKNGQFLGRGDFPETVFFREMRQLRDAGYRLNGDYMVPTN